MSLRDLIRRVVPRGQSYHLATSSGIASAAICGLKFRLPNFLGAAPDQEDNESFIPGLLAHKVLEDSAQTLPQLWSRRAVNGDILNAWQPYMDEVFSAHLQEQETNPTTDPRTEINDALIRLHGIADVLEEKFVHDPVPNRVIPELTITNTFTLHEGRPDLVCEYDTHQETVQWKTYSDGRVTPKDRLQTICDGMLVNYRYGRRESDFASNRLTLITPNGHTNFRPTQRAINTIMDARNYVLQTLRGLFIRSPLPFIGVCNSCPYLRACLYYRNNRIRDEQTRVLFRTRYQILKKRERSHVNKFLAERLSLDQLRDLGIVDYYYNLDSVDLLPERMYQISLRKHDNNTFSKLYEGDSVRIIGLEPNTPLLASVSCLGSIRQIQGNTARLEIYRGHPYQLQTYPIALLRVDIDLTKRELESVDFVHRSGWRVRDIAFAILGW